ncbi:MAG: hypothetical protein ACHQSE_05940 [Gemmatimonadales bacterium]
MFTGGTDVHKSSWFAGSAGCTILAAVLALPASGCSKSSPSAPAAPPAPTLTGISPGSGVRGTTVPVTLTGTNFLLEPGATHVLLSGGMYLTGDSVLSTTSITASFLVTDLVPLGAAQVAVMTAGGTSAHVSFTVLRQPPTLATVTPNFGGQGATMAVTLTGTNFLSGATSVDVDGGGVTADNVVVVSSGSLTAHFAIDSGATLGLHGVTVTTAGGTSASVPFTVNTPPRVTGAIPSSRRRAGR